MQTNLQFIKGNIIFWCLINIFLKRCLFNKIIAWMVHLVIIFPEIWKLVYILESSSLLTYFRLIWSHYILNTLILRVLRRWIAEFSLLNQVWSIKMVHVISETFIPEFNIFYVFLPSHLILMVAILYSIFDKLPILESIIICILIILKIWMEIGCTTVNVLLSLPNFNVIYCNIQWIFDVWVFKYSILSCCFLFFLTALLKRFHQLRFPFQYLIFFINIEFNHRFFWLFFWI